MCKGDIFICIVYVFTIVFNVTLGFCFCFKDGEGKSRFQDRQMQARKNEMVQFSSWSQEHRPRRVLLSRWASTKPGLWAAPGSTSRTRARGRIQTALPHTQTCSSCILSCLSKRQLLPLRSGTKPRSHSSLPRVSAQTSPSLWSPPWLPYSKLQQPSLFTSSSIQTSGPDATLGPWTGHKI